ncbi:MAG: 3-hydroxyacyl-ACP dehydratase FabZ family protein [Zavarzinella sp.]
MRHQPFIDLQPYYNAAPIATREEIRKFLPHRDHMEHLTAVVHLDTTNHILVGYKDVLEDEFWTSGHMPGYPILPGVLMIEAAAQLLCYYVLKTGLLSDVLLGLGGVENARFRTSVRPGERLYLLCKGNRVDRRQMNFTAQGFVNDKMAFQCDVIGMVIPGQDYLKITSNE